MAIAFVQSCSKAQNAGGSGLAKISQSFSAAVTTGNNIVVGFTWGSGASEYIPSVYDSKGNSYARLTSSFDTTNHQSVGLFCASNVAGGTNFWVTASADSGGSSGDFYAFIAVEWSGLQTANSGGYNVGSASFGAVSVGTDTWKTPRILPTSDGELIFAGGAGTSGLVNATIGTGFTGWKVTDGVIDFYAEYKIQTTATATSGTFSPGSAVTATAAVAAFFAASAASVGPVLRASNLYQLRNVYKIIRS